MSARKRKATEELQDDDTRMSQSPSSSPSLPNSQLPSQPTPSRLFKKARKNLSGRPLALPRLLETLSADEMRTLLRQLTDHNPNLAAAVLSTAPRPSVQSTLSVLQTYETSLRQALPFGVPESSDYTYNRIKAHLLSFLDALKDFTPQFLPPHETQTSVSLQYLDAVTEMVHALPNWESFAQNRHKADAYEELAKAWALVVAEASKRAGGFQLQFGGWDQKVMRHNELSGGKMEEAVVEMRTSLGFVGERSCGEGPGPSVREQLASGTYGLDMAVRVGPW